MSNMSYCRFQNTALDLADCVANWNEQEEEDLDDDEVDSYENTG